MELQKRFKGDERFKLDDEFGSDDEADKDHEMDTLQSKFNSGMTLNDKFTKSKNEWNTMLFYDPDAHDAGELEREVPKEIKSKVVAAPAPAVDKTKHFEVYEELHSFFNAEQQGFLIV